MAVIEEYYVPLCFLIELSHYSVCAHAQLTEVHLRTGETRYKEISHGKFLGIVNRLM